MMEIELENIESDIKVLNAVEFAMLQYAKERKFIGNPYQYFSESLGYKSKNYLYRFFKERSTAKIGWKDLEKITKETKDKNLQEALIEEIKGWVK